MFWFKVWFGLAAVMLILLIVTESSTKVYGLCFFAWCGGVVSTLTLQEFLKRRETERKVGS